MHHLARRLLPVAPLRASAAVGWRCDGLGALSHAPAVRHFNNSIITSEPKKLPPAPKKVRRTFEEAGRAAIAAWDAKNGPKGLRKESDEPQQSALSGAVYAAGALYAAASEDQYVSSTPRPSLQVPLPTGKLRSAPAAVVFETADAPLSLASEVVWLYRTTLRHVRVIEAGARRDTARADARSQFREMQKAAAAAEAEAASDVTSNSDTPASLASSTPLATAAAAASPADARARKLLSTAYSRLSFLRMSTPKLLQPRLTRVPAYPGARALFGNPGGPALYGENGEVITEEERKRMIAAGGTVGGRNVSNSQGVTDEQRRRHYEQVDRMNFRGPRWAGKPKY